MHRQSFGQPSSHNGAHCLPLAVSRQNPLTQSDACSHAQNVPPGQLWVESSGVRSACRASGAASAATSPCSPSLCPAASATGATSVAATVGGGSPQPALAISSTATSPRRIPKDATRHTTQLNPTGNGTSGKLPAAICPSRFACQHHCRPLDPTPCVPQGQLRDRTRQCRAGVVAAASYLHATPLTLAIAQVLK